jgi:hypothetical protein
MATAGATLHDPAPALHQKSVAEKKKTMPHMAPKTGVSRTSETKPARMRVPPINIAAAISISQGRCKTALHGPSFEVSEEQGKALNALHSGSGEAPMLPESEDNSSSCSNSDTSKETMEAESKPLTEKKVCPPAFYSCFNCENCGCCGQQLELNVPCTPYIGSSCAGAGRLCS